MAQTITLHLPEETLQRYQQGAAAARKPLEEFLVERLVLQRGLSGLRLPSTLMIDLKRTLSMGAIGRIIAHLMIPDDFNSPLQIKVRFPQRDGQQRPRLW